MSGAGINPFSRVLSLRDRRKPRIEADELPGVFWDDSRKKPSREEERKILELRHLLSRLGLDHVPDGRLEYALRARSVHGDISEAVRLLHLLDETLNGIVKPYNPHVHILGAENRERTTCYLDALLFAMFSKPDVFEAVLYGSFNDDDSRKRLRTIIRLWVNLLRTGRLITVDITQKLQEALAETGWADAAKTRQQDASEAFNFLTDKLSLPLLTLKTDLFHSGKEDANDDHKFVTERMLDVAIPEDVQSGETITLEMCLEEYFNNRVEVKRHLMRRDTLAPAGSMDKEDPILVDSTEVDSIYSSSPIPASPFDPPAQQPVKRPPQLRERALSIFSERKVSLTDDTKNGSEADPTSHSRARANSTRKEVLMPAWQFINLIPWYSDQNPQNDAQAKAHFATQRPMLGICLKRYAVSSNGTSTRLSTYVDIPLELASPHFAGEELGSDSEELQSANFKLSLQSVVCHRGHSVDAGHYIALVRTPPSGADRNDAFADAESTQTHDQTHDAWLRFDDLASERVQSVDIVKALREESPYLLFYRVEPIQDEPIPMENPPPYEESTEFVDIVDRKLSMLPESGRHSLEISDPSRRASLDLATVRRPNGKSSTSSLRRSSIAVTQQTPDGSIKFDQVGTEPTTPEEPKASTAPSQSHASISREPSKSDTASGDAIARPPSSGNGAGDKRFGMSIAKITSRLSRDKLNNPSITVDEVFNDSVIAKAVVQSGDEFETRPKDKKRKFLSSRRGSTGKNKPPDRECNVM